jgi:hypothetical protein
MPSYSESLIPSARAAKDASSTGGTTQTTLVCGIVGSIATACDSSLYTIATSVVSVSSVDLQYVLEVLHTSGYTATVSGTTLTVTWGGS